MDDHERWRAVGADIRARAKDAGLNQTKLGELIGATQGVVSDDMRGPTKGIPRSRLLAYAEVLGTEHYDVWVNMAYGRNESDATRTA